MSACTFVKWGGSLITDKTTPFTLRPDVLKRLAQELSEEWLEQAGHLILGHGGGSFGHVAAAHANSESTSVAQDISAIQHAMGRLHCAVIDALRAVDLPAVSFRPSNLLISDGGAPVSCHIAALEQALTHGALPVVCGDVTLDRSRSWAICSTEIVFRTIIDALHKQGHPTDRVLWCGNTDGVYDAQGATLSHLTPTTAADLLPAFSDPEGTDVTGGITHRVETALTLAEQGIESVILNGDNPGDLKAALRNAPRRATRVTAGR